ncbi:hypothetical protein BDP81DRAFT_140982 [Colletotrichum phormii]|uniref:Uncharacterized protein n=1 Tax=Colletotrichum phormii TaxID=359342 RepID=A0AAJ0E9K8_9PEZI|nr:uncharacterized protein BDP81DRAFT_140982 [Colletotrichum phormii]KAK1622920.1 hypothetical protein BDP81DRAFT_140982 [Colletotrichum phormii]
MKNYVKFIQTYYTRVSDVITTTSLRTAEISSTFIAPGSSTLEMSPAAWMTIASRGFTAVGAFLGPAGGIADGVAGLLTAAAGVAGAANSDATDPRFTNFAGLNTKLADMKLAIQSAMEAYFQRLFVNSPPNHDNSRGTELANLLSSGYWANQDLASLSAPTYGHYAVV